MNENKPKYILEIIYNCPFILLVVFTSFLVLPFFDRIENCKNGENIAEFYTTVPEEEPPAVEEPLENEGIRKEENSKIENEKEQNNDETVSQNAVIKPKEEFHLTEFVEYTPIETDSRYYSDAGKVALTTTYDYILENDSYFNDAAFLGDSRTLGISDYAGLEGADFFCDNGMTIYKLLEDGGVTWQRTGEKVDMKTVLQEKQYGKIYIMLGMNELGYGDTPMYKKQYSKVIRQLRKWQPEAIIYVMANLHVSREKNNMESEFNNVNINDKNVAAARLANGRDIFYLDCNPLFTDEEGYLRAELTFDGVHLYAQHYDKWRDFLMEHGVERAEETETPAENESVIKNEDAAGSDNVIKNDDAAGSDNAADKKDTAENAVSPEEG